MVYFETSQSFENSKSSETSKSIPFKELQDTVDDSIVIFSITPPQIMYIQKMMKVVIQVVLINATKGTHMPHDIAQQKKTGWNHQNCDTLS